MPRVILVSMPFGSSLSPALGISLLRQVLLQKGFTCDLRYLQLPYAARIGSDLYGYLANSYPTILLGEWLFADILFAGKLPPRVKYETEILQKYVGQHRRGIPGWVLARLPELQSLSSVFLEECLLAIAWESYDLIGFTSTFSQNLASLALAMRIKERWPEKIIVFGGANWEGEMGLELLKNFPFVDYACSGEADQLFPKLVEQLAGGQGVHKQAGLFIQGERIPEEFPKYNAAFNDLDSLPFPDFNDYFEQLSLSGLIVDMDHVSLLMETSRGCWWGARQQCKFCGLNGSTITYRSKSSQRALEELRWLARKYPQVHRIFMVDNILNMDYFDQMLPNLEQENLNLSITYEVKVNLNKEQIRRLKMAGVDTIQPGIESLDNRVLRLMSKGCTSIQNIQTLKWARGFGQKVSWNLLAGFPDEPPESYREMAEMLPDLAHLQPPTSSGVSWLRLDRFSPYFKDPEAMGIVNVRPVPAYRYVYPFPEDSLGHLAYYFDFDYADERDPHWYVAGLDHAIQEWHRQVYLDSNAPTLYSLNQDDRLIIYDSRPRAVQAEYILEGVARQIYEYCDEARSLSAIRHFLADKNSMVADLASIQPILDELVAHRLIIFLDGRYLSLGISIDDQVQKTTDGLFASLIASEEVTS